MFLSTQLHRKYNPRTRNSKTWWIHHSTETNRLSWWRIHLQHRRPQFNFSVGKSHWRRDRLPTPVFLGFPWDSAGKEFACNEGDLDLIPGFGRSPGKGKGYPLQYSGLENSMDCIYSPWGHKDSDRTEQLSLSLKPEMLNVYPVGIDTHFNALWSLPTKATHVAQSVHSLPWRNKACDLGNLSSIYLLLMYSFRYGSLNLVGRL